MSVKSLRQAAGSTNAGGDLTLVSPDELLALLDVVDAAPRNLACHALPEKVALPPDVEDCGECEACRFNAALARVDGTEAL